MAFGTSTTWLFCWALGKLNQAQLVSLLPLGGSINLTHRTGISLPSCLESLGNIGTFGLYTGFCILGYCMIFFLVPESKQYVLPAFHLPLDYAYTYRIRYTLEELDRVFSVGVIKHAKFQTQAAMQRLGLQGRGQPKLDLLTWASLSNPVDATIDPSEVETGMVKQEGEKRVENASSASL